MILTSLTRALKTQNWVAVAIEFVIVIAGVVIGFQVTGWAEDRNAQAREAVLLARIETDFRTIEADALEALVYTNRLLETKHALIAAFDSDYAEYDDARLIQDVARAFHMRSPIAGSPTYDELLAAGELTRLGSPELRAALARFARSYDRHLGVSNSLVGTFDIYDQLMTANAIALLVTDADDLPPDMVARLNALVREPGFLDAVLRFRAVQDYVYYWHNDNLEKAREVLASLGAEPMGGPAPAKPVYVTP